MVQVLLVYFNLFTASCIMHKEVMSLYQGCGQDLNFEGAIHALRGAIQKLMLTKLGRGAWVKVANILFCNFSSVCMILLSKNKFLGG